MQHVVLKDDMFAIAYAGLSGDLKYKISTFTKKKSISTGDDIGYIGPSGDRQGISGGSSGHQGISGCPNGLTWVFQGISGGNQGRLGIPQWM